MFGKSVCLLAILAPIAVIANTVPNPSYAQALTDKGSHNLYAGIRQKCDRLALRQPAYKPGTSEFTNLETTFSVGKGETITMLSALDLDPNNTGAYPTIMSGGPGYNKVTIRFESQKGLSVNFIVELYAKPSRTNNRRCETSNTAARN